ncbi:malate dehydrogenase (quinone) [Mycolicibacterium moriokaense]|uniref:Probable malate:quinone oxidoreductase n=2 Tax=Mycolicibacterium moriokaense TaxID=39691 RepID=A0A318HLI1_9MYCO|nr:malate dehydrogenase (quinone) [Mycolicibacterium moriokaense]PXX12096.1 malate dehydrogenase (quinone) [Mycolicibacterium moriokaense]
MSDPKAAQTDVLLVGAGIMSATLGALLRLVEPNWTITLIERLDGAAAESSGPWHNAGTGHAGLCELNYTPQRTDGSIDISKAIQVNEQFQVTRQFWAYAVENRLLPDVRSFLNPIPHVSFVKGEANIDYLKRRHDALAGNPLFASMEFIADDDEFARRLPLMATGRSDSDPIALAWAQDGTDVDFGALSRQLIGYTAQGGMTTLFGHEVRDLRKESDGSWTVAIVNRRTEGKRKVNAKFVFIGAGGGAVPLLQKSGIREAKGYGGFPVGGAFLRTDRRALTAAHRAKVYTLPSAGAPPMAGTHLDNRVINSKSWLVFGPFAGWSPKFLKQGKITDLPRSVRPNNLAPMVTAGLKQVPLVRYLIGQLLQSEARRVQELREFVPSAVDSDWKIDIAGQRVQVIRRANGKGGVLDFGTTVLSAADGSIAGLLGASPGASTAVPAMLDVMERCFGDRYKSWSPKLKEIVPSLGTELSGQPALFEEVWSWGTKVLKLDRPASGVSAAAAIG